MLYILFVIYIHIRTIIVSDVILNKLKCKVLYIDIFFAVLLTAVKIVNYLFDYRRMVKANQYPLCFLLKSYSEHKAARRKIICD